MKEINRIWFDWFYTTEIGEEYVEMAVGYQGVIRIEEHLARGEGDRVWYDIFFENGEMQRTFNPSRVFYVELKDG